MHKPALTEAVQTDLPSPKPTRRGRLALRFAVLAAAASVLFAAYWFTRPPELVWWRSPEIGKTGLHAHVLVPYGWAASGPINNSAEEDPIFSETYDFKPVNRTPWYLRWIVYGSVVSPRDTMESITLYVEKSRVTNSTFGREIGTIETREYEGSTFMAIREVVAPDRRTWASVEPHSYARPYYFHRTYRQICNSLTIE